MLWAPCRQQFGVATNTTGAGTVTPGASSAEGSWATIVTAPASNVWGFYVEVYGGSTGGQSKQHLLDIGVDPAGGTSFTAIITDLPCGGSANSTDLGHQSFYFPLYIPANATVGARIEGSNATAGTVTVLIRLFGQPSRPEGIVLGSFSETIGLAGSGSLGTSVTPGNGTAGSWVSLGTTTQHLYWWQIGVQLDNAAVTAGRQTYFELAYGDGTNKHVICERFVQNTGAEEIFELTSLMANEANCYFPVPAGATLYMRATCSAAPDTGWNVAAVGVGGTANSSRGTILTPNPSRTNNGFGTTVTPGTSGSEGSWTQVASALGHSVRHFQIAVSGNYVSAQSKLFVADVGIDPAGGTSYSAIITDFVCGNNSGGAPWVISAPFWIPAGATVAVRIAGSHGTATNSTVFANFWGGGGQSPYRPSAQYSETVGVSGTSGTAFTPGNGSYGSWASLGTTSRDWWAIQAGMQCNDTTKTTQATTVQIAYGDATNKVVALEFTTRHLNNESEGMTRSSHLTPAAMLTPIPSGATIYVRGLCDTTPNSNYQAAAYGFGG